MRMYFFAILIPTSTALAQSSVIIDVESSVLMPGESTTVTMWAAFPTSEFAMAGIATDLLSSIVGEGWSDLELVRPMDSGPGTTPGAPVAWGVEGILAGQIYFPPDPSLDPSNPIAFWRAIYTAPPEVATPMEVELSTRTSQFMVYTRPEGTALSFLDGLVEGGATIHVVPAPVGAVVLGVWVLATGRRRR